MADGTKLENARYCTVDPDGYMRMEDGSPIQLFTKVTTDGMTSKCEGSGRIT